MEKENDIKKWVVVVNILVQLLWFSIAGVATYFITKIWFAEIDQPLRSILGGLSFLGIIVFLSIVTNIIKAIKDPDVIAASKLHLTLKQKKLYDLVFDYIIHDETINDERISGLLSDFLVQNPKSWEKYCFSRKNEYVPLYRIGKEIFAYNEEEKKYVRGIIIDISWRISWWQYEVVFDEDLSIDNSWPSKKKWLSAKVIQKIETGNVYCGNCHYVYANKEYK